MRLIGLAVALSASVLLAPAAFLWPAGSLDAQPAREQPRFGGVLKVATIGEPPSLDSHGNASVVTSAPMWHVFETLFTFDGDFNPIPLLAEGHALADGGRRYTITLRKGVRFHNGKELTAADVVASLNRWGSMAADGRSLWTLVREVDAKGSHEVVIHLREPYADLVSSLAAAQGGAAIYPKEVIDVAGNGPLKQFIGTGPFRLVEHRPKVHVRLARFKEYTARNEPPNGAGGKRVAYLDELLFVPVPDMAVRLAGVESGSYHYGFTMWGQYDRIFSMRSVEPRRGPPRLSRRRAQSQARADDIPEAAAGTSGRPRHGAHHGRRGRPPSLLPPRPGTPASGAGAPAFNGWGRALQPEGQS